MRYSLARVRWGLLMVVLMLPGAVLLGCDGASDALAPYEGTRPLILQRVTQSPTSDIQWLGGRVAAIGVNRGDVAALDETLVWIRRADEDAISSHVTVGEDGDDEFVRTVGGEPIEQLEDSETYTFWLATTEALDAGLDTTQLNRHAFVDTTITMELLLRGRAGGDPSLDFEAQIARNERLVGTEFILSWEPEDLNFRQIAIRRSGTGGFTDLVWHAVVPDGEPPSISSPVVVGEPPAGTQEVIEFEGFGAETYTLWMVTDEWGGNFGVRSEGYVFFTILSTNFEEPAEEGGEDGE